MENKYIACMILHAVGDTVGFKNSEWEFIRGNSLDRTLEKLYEFIELGGVNQISLKDWRVSDDTIMHIQTASSILTDFNSMNSLGKIFKDNFVDALNQFEKEGYKMRYPGTTTLESLKTLKEGKEWNEIPYDLMSGGSGASMRSLCIGLAFHGEQNRDKLIQISIESGRMTNNSAVGYLGAFASALFTALAVEGKKINTWPFTLLDLMNSKVGKYMKSAGRDVDQYENDHHTFMDKWHRYVDDKFDNNKNPITRKSDRNLLLRGKYYNDTFGMKIPIRGDSKFVVKNNWFIGSGGDDSVIIAYDCLLDSGKNWEKLVIYSMLHMGDTDTTGAIAAGLYGVLYEFEGVPDNFMEYLEYKKELNDLGKKLYKKFYKK